MGCSCGSAGGEGLGCIGQWGLDLIPVSSCAAPPANLPWSQASGEPLASLVPFPHSQCWSSLSGPSQCHEHPSHTGQHREMNCAWLECFRAWDQLPGCEYPFPAPGLPQRPSLLLWATAHIAPASTGTVWQQGSKWDLPAARKVFWVWLTRVTWELSSQEMKQLEGISLVLRQAGQDAACALPWDAPVVPGSITPACGRCRMQSVCGSQPAALTRFRKL